jgi:hypothetical protein
MLQLFHCSLLQVKPTPAQSWTLFNSFVEHILLQSWSTENQWSKSPLLQQGPQRLLHHGPLDTRLALSTHTSGFYYVQVYCTQ